MRKFVIRGEEKKEEPPLEFYLSRTVDGSIYLRVNEYSLVCVRAQDSKLLRLADVGADLGLPLDSHGRIMLGED